MLHTIGDKRHVGKHKTRWNEAVVEDSKKILSIRNQKQKSWIDKSRQAIYTRPRPDIGLLPHARRGGRSGL
jgi:hypothetical protein